MTVEAARAMIVATADYGTGELQSYARRVLETWGEQTAPEERQGPMTGAERSRLYREKQRKKRAGIVTERDERPSRNATEIVTERDGAVTAPSRALPSSSPGSSSLSSSPALSPSETLDLGVTGGSTGARAGAGNCAANGAVTEVQSGTFALVTSGASRETSRRVTKRDAKTSRIPLDWQPTAETVSECESKGVDARATVAEFVDYWDDEADRRKARAFKSPRGWQRAFVKNVDWLLREGRAPMLPPAPPAPPPRGDPAQAASVIAMMNGNAMPATIAATKELKRG